ncbi:calcium-binding protein [Cognatishimia sp. F0-27]|uniref:calcium-binding protein n=1 Tax=Cognatishimia sp. F0-27 TaxID=2816855 RepID=UPI001D0C82B5|nr:calcium-binding protein [Cognatishimia sp. F0-27]MCC1492267.1 hypothetical protein [Cognatishimia sp. F0-27]
MPVTAIPQFYQVSSNGMYVTPIPEDMAGPATRLSLSELGVSPGDTLFVEPSGDYDNGNGELFFGLAGVFQGNAGFIAPAFSTAEEFSHATLRGQTPGDISEDFRLDPDGSFLTVPAGATHLVLATPDELVRDNSDVDMDYGALISFREAPDLSLTEVPQFFSVNERGMYTVPISSDRPEPATALSLEDLGLGAGDAFFIEYVGDYSFDFGPNDITSGMIAVFRNADGFLAPAGTSAEGFMHVPLRGEAPVDVPEDVEIGDDGEVLIVPEGATELVLATTDQLVLDNADSDNDYGALLSRPGVLDFALTESSDRYSGIAGGETIAGLAGDDQIAGNAGDDALSGEAGNDTLEGGSGDDTLEGGTGDDLLDGGAGADRAVFATARADVMFSDGGTGVRVTGGDEDDVITGIETLVFSDGVFALSDLLPGVADDGSPTDDSLTGGLGDDLLSGRFGNDTLDGGPGADTMRGDQGFDLLTGGPGADTLLGLNGFDTLEGGAGADEIFGNNGNDSLNGGAGDDLINGGLGADSAEGGAGDDDMRGLDGFDSLDGGAGRDTLSGNAGNDSLSGGEGRDLLAGGNGFDRLDGGGDSDTLDGNNGFDTLVGGDGDDLLNGNFGNDSLDAGAGDDTANGGLGADTIETGAGDDVVSGGNGGDLIRGGEGDDRLFGNAGNDSLEGDDPSGAGDDYLDGGLGNDTLHGGLGSDTIIGGAGNDVLSASGVTGEGGNALFDGGDGADTISLGVDGQGNATATGGAGADVFNWIDDGHDVIVDFEPGVDTLVLLRAQFAGVETAEDLVGLVSFTDGNAVFGGGASSLTLLGVDESEAAALAASIDFAFG